MVASVLDVLWLVRMCKELKIDVKTLIELLSDNMFAIQIVANPIFHERTKHIEIKLHFIQEKIQDGIIKTSHVASKDQEANCSHYLP